MTFHISDIFEHEIDTSVPIRFCMYEECYNDAVWDHQGQKYCKNHIHLATNFKLYKSLVDWSSFKKKKKN